MRLYKIQASSFLSIFFWSQFIMLPPRSQHNAATRKKDFYSSAHFYSLKQRHPSKSRFYGQSITVLPSFFANFAYVRKRNSVKFMRSSGQRREKINLTVLERFSSERKREREREREKERE